VIGSKTLFTANAFVRQDHLLYTPSANPFADQPGTVSQDRKLTNVGVKADVAYTTANHNVKVGGTISKPKAAVSILFSSPSFTISPPAYLSQRRPASC